MRRAIRIIIIVMTTILIGVAVLAQWWGVVMYAGKVAAGTHASDVTFVWWLDPKWGLHTNSQAGKHFGYFTWPEKSVVDGTIIYIVLPWWSVAVVWALVAVPLWRWARRTRFKAKGFPVEAV